MIAEAEVLRQAGLRRHALRVEVAGAMGVTRVRVSRIGKERLARSTPRPPASKPSAGN